VILHPSLDGQQRPIAFSHAPSVERTCHSEHPRIDVEGGDLSSLAHHRGDLPRDTPGSAGEVQHSLAAS